MLQLVFVNRETVGIRSVMLSGRQLLVAAGLLSLFAFCSGVAFYRIGADRAYQKALSQPALQAWQQQLDEQKQLVQEARQNAQANIEVLTKKVAVLQSHILRLDALGERLVSISDLDQGEFDFSVNPGQGGPDVAEEESGVTQEVNAPNFIGDLVALEKRISEHQRQFAVLESLFRTHELVTNSTIQGRPVVQGWISSYYGWRVDPFTGNRGWHGGVDIAGKPGSTVLSVASGIVRWAGPKGGYGNLVEIDHGNGYVTRYGHNRKVLVKPGMLVAKGEQVAEMGTTGHSTGPHVHFEVIRDGKTRNPIDYFNRKLASRKL